MTIIVNIPEYGVEQPIDPATGRAWASQEAADAWRDAILAAMEERYRKQMEPATGPDIAAIAEEARVAIDLAAGETRLKFITDVPGQGAVYMRKMEQAKAYRDAGFAGPVPAYISAESQALQVTPQEAAEGILEVANLWDEVLSPAIEGIRFGFKRKVDVLASTVTEDKRQLATQIAAVRAGALEAFNGVAAQAATANP